MKTSMRNMALVFALGGIAASCQSTNLEDLSAFGDSAATVADDASVAYYKDDELIPQGKLQFQEKNYGKAYAIYKKAVEVFPQDPAAWLGYAASSDMIARFDNADRAYGQLQKMIGDSPVYFNNLGYSYLLRGDLPTARRYFIKAYEIDPSNPVTANNLQLLKNSVKYAQR